jgi:hypothetical protein
MNLGTGRVAIIVLLAAAGIAVLVGGFTEPEGGTVAAPTSTGSPTVTGTPTPTGSVTAPPTETPEPQQDGVLIAVLNGTDVTGLAGEVQTMLVKEGYRAPGPAGNAPIPNVPTTTVYYRPGDNAAQNMADATYLSETFFEGSEVGKLSSVFDNVVGNTVTVVVVVGKDYAEAVAA